MALDGTREQKRKSLLTLIITDSFGFTSKLYAINLLKKYGSLSVRFVIISSIKSFREIPLH